MKHSLRKGRLHREGTGWLLRRIRLKCWIVAWCLTVAFLGVWNGRAATVVSGVQSGTWTRAQSPIEVADDVVVATGTTLTIEPGVEVRFREPWVDLWVEGALVALGTLETPIKFSSDENVVAGGQWGGIIIRDSSDDAATQLTHCVLEGGGGYREEMLRVESASPRISDCLVRLSRWRGIMLVRSDASIQGCRIEDNPEYAIAMDPASFPVLRGNGARGNGGNAIGIFGGNLTRSGTWVRDDLPYTVIDDIAIAAGATLTLEPGVKVLFQDPWCDLFVDGGLVARGTAAQPILFSSNETEKQPNQWGAIQFRGGSDDATCVLEHCVIEAGGGYAQEMLRIENASPLVRECEVRKSRWRGATLAGSDARIERCRFLGNASYAIGMDTDSLPILRGNTASGNGGDSVAILPGSVRRSGTWVRDDIPYTILDDVVIGSSTILTLEPGVTVQFEEPWCDLIVDGALVAKGTETQPIRFTSNEAIKGPNQWGGIIFRDSSDDAVNVLEHCVVEAGGAYREENIRMEKASPLLRQSTIRLGRWRGISLIGSDARIEFCRMMDNVSYAIGMDTDSFPKLQGNSASGNGGDAIGIFPGVVRRRGSWVRDELPYTILDDVLVAEANVLTVDPGVTIQFQDPWCDFIIDGALVARGTAARPIRFTSNEVEKLPNQWGAILFRDSSDDAASVLEHGIIEAGGAYQEAVLHIFRASPTIKECEIRFSRADGVWIGGGAPNILGSRILKNGRDGIRTVDRALPVLRQNSFADNAEFAVRNWDPTVVVDARMNFWGDVSGPRDTVNTDGLNQLNPTGKGGAVSEYVDWSGLLGVAPGGETGVPEILILPARLDFGSVLAGQSRALSLAIRSVGTAALRIDSLISDSVVFDLGSETGPLIVNSGSEQQLVVRYRPVGLGAQTGVLTLKTSDPQRAVVRVPMTGTAAGAAPLPHVAAVSPETGPPGTSVYVVGENFAPTPDGNVVRVGDRTVVPLSVTPNRLVVAIPDGLPLGDAAVRVEVGGRASEPVPFRVVAAGAGATGAPTLRIHRVAPGDVELDWDASPAGFELERLARVSERGSWSAAAGTPVRTGDRWSLRQSTFGDAGYFRLRGKAGNGVLRLPDDWVPTIPVIESTEVRVPAAGGGTLRLGNGATVTIPPGALPEDRTIQFSRLDLSQYTTGMTRDVYRIDAGTNRLAKAATLEFPHPNPSSGAPASVHRADPGEFLTELPVISQANGVVRAQTDHFSVVGVEEGKSYGLTFFDTLNDPNRSKVLDVPYYSQEVSQWCFVASSQMLLKYYGIDVEPWDIAKHFGTKIDEGAGIWQLWVGNYSEYFAGLGLQVRETSGWLAPALLNGYLIQQIDAGRPVFLVIRHATHAIMVVGYSQGGIFVHDPSGYAIALGTGAKPAGTERARRFLDWNQWGHVLTYWPDQFIPVALPAWTIVADGAPGHPASLASMTLPSASMLDTGIAGGALVVERPNPNPNGPGFLLADEAQFFWNGTRRNGYEFAPRTGFLPPPNLAITDQLLLKLNLHNAGLAPMSVSLRVRAGDRVIHESAAPIELPGIRNSQEVEIFGGRNPFKLSQLRDGSPFPGAYELIAELIAGGSVVDTVPISLDVGPSRPTGLKKQAVSGGVSLRWDPNPEAVRGKIEYEISDGTTTRLGISGTSHVIATAEGGRPDFTYRVIAREPVTGLKSPPSLPATSEDRLVYVRSDPPTILMSPADPKGEELVSIRDSGVDVQFAGRSASILWPLPPKELVADVDYTWNFIPSWAAHEIPIGSQTPSDSAFVGAIWFGSSREPPAPRVSDPSQVNREFWMSSGYFSANDCNCWRRSVEPWSWHTLLRGPDEPGKTFYLVVEIQTARHFAKVIWKYTEKGP